MSARHFGKQWSDARVTIAAMPETHLTFRDFAGAVMGGNDATAVAVLQQLLGLEPVAAETATAAFRTGMTAGGPAFMGKAMGLRTAVSSGTDAAIAALLADCFGLAEPALATAVRTLRGTYPT